MFKTYRNFILIFLVVIATLLFFLKKYNDILEKEEVDILVSKNIEIITNKISNQKKHALSLAILFSKNQNIITLLEQNKPNELKNELNTLLSVISHYTDIKNIQIQVHTKDLKVFIRNWENKDQGLNLKSFRKGLVKVKQTQKPYVSNELGKRLNIKAIAPIFDKNKNYIGSIEVITDYTQLQKELSLLGVSILPLLNSSFLHIAKYHQNNKKLHNFVLISKEYDQKIYDLIFKNPQLLSQEQYYYQIEGKIITSIPIGNIDGKTTGLIVAVFNKNIQKFNYLPKYEYLGEVTTTIDTLIDGNGYQRKEILIK